MKKITIKSKLKETDILKRLQSMTDFFISKGKLAKGDELVIGLDDQDDGSFLVELDASLMSPEDYKSAKKDFLQLGKVVSSDLKDFDDKKELENSNEVTPTSETPKEEKQDAVDENSVKPAIQVHDTKELLFNKDDNMFENLKSLLFSDEELKAPENPKVEEPETHDAPKPEDAAEKPEEPTKDTTPENPDKKAETHDNTEKKPEGDPNETPADKVKDVAEEEKKNPATPEVKNFDSLYFSEDEINPMSTLYFSEEELKDSEMQTFDSLYFSEDEIAGVETQNFDSLYFSEDEIAGVETQNFDSLYFSEDELHDVTPTDPKREPAPNPAPAPVAEPAKKSLEEVLKEYEKTKKPYTKEAVADECGCSVEDVVKKMKEMKLMDKEGVLVADPVTNPGVKKDESPAKPESSIDKVEALKNLARLNKEAKAGRELNFVEKHFCNTVSQMFSEEEVAQAEKAAAEVSPEKVKESKMEMLRRLNKENGKVTLAQHCKEMLNKK